MPSNRSTYFVVAFTYISFFAHNGWVVRVRCSHYGFPNYLFPLTTTTSTFFKTKKKKKNLPFGGGITKEV